VGEAVYAAKIGREELKLDWSRPAIELERLIRVGRAWTTFRGRRLIIESARVAVFLGRDGEDGSRDLAPGSVVGETVVCGDGRLELLEVRPEGRSAQGFSAWRRGARPVEGECLGT
jgi:methionyl-tRNA formyltransferase